MMSGISKTTGKEVSVDNFVFYKNTHHLKNLKRRVLH
jgi:hypothetical protein